MLVIQHEKKGSWSKLGSQAVSTRDLQVAQKSKSGGNFQVSNCDLLPTVEFGTLIVRPAERNNLNG
jgi:hypothetical protein